MSLASLQNSKIVLLLGVPINNTKNYIGQFFFSSAVLTQYQIQDLFKTISNINYFSRLGFTIHIISSSLTKGRKKKHKPGRLS